MPTPLPALAGWSLLLLLLAPAVRGSTDPTAYRGATVAWQRADPSTRAVQFTVRAFFQATYFGSATSGTAVTLDATHTWAFAYGESGATRLLDASVCTLQSVGDVAEAVCRFTYTYTTGAGPFTAAFQSAARDAALQNNADQGFRVATVVALTGAGAGPNNSPVVGVAPITRVAVPTGTAQAAVALLAADPEGDALAYRLTAGADMTGTATPGVQPAGLAIDAATGAITWALAGLAAGTYSVSVQVLDTAGAMVTVDWTLELSFYTPPRAFPTFQAPTTNTSRQVIHLNQGQTQLQFNVVAQAAAAPTIMAAGLPAGATVSSAVSGTTTTTTVQWTPASGASLAVACFSAANAGIISPPVCVHMAAYQRCSGDCWGNGACRSLYGTCRCQATACLADCRAVWRDPAYSTGCTVTTLAVAFSPNVRGAVASATVEARFPVGQPLGTELWVTLPAGMTTSRSPDVMVALAAVQLFDNATGVAPAAASSPSVVVTPDGGTVELRFGQAFQASDAVRFTLTNLQLPNNCDPMQWTVTPMQCGMQDLFGAGAVWKRVCQPVAGVAPLAVTYNHMLACDLCNACRLWQACPDNSQGFTCEHEGVRFTRCGLGAAVPCSTLGV